MRTISTTIFFLLFISTIFGQQLEKSIDSLISVKTTKPFNGVILVSQNGNNICSKIMGYNDMEKKKPLNLNDEFVIGSISKQFTAVLVLQEYDRGRLKLSEPIHKYLPELTDSWAEKVTAHHLLTHTHGITEIGQPTNFAVGTQYEYSQIGFDLLAKIIERTSGKSFAKLSEELFNKCEMTNTFHPDIKKYENLVRGYTEQSNSDITFDTRSLESYPAAGSFISTAEDLILWNQNLHEGKLLKPSTFKLMTSKQKKAVRQHPIFGQTEYGYGITINTKGDLLQLGQTGFAPGFVSMNFYFPKSKTSVIVLANIAYDTDDIKKTFIYHTEILKIIRQEQKNYR